MNAFAIPGIGLLVLAFSATAFPADTTLAILCPPRNAELENLQAIAEPELSLISGISLVDRQAIDRILKEHKLTLSGLVDSQTAVRVGQLVRADLLVFLEPTSINPGKNGGGGACMIYDSENGVRYIDRALTAPDLPSRRKELCQAVVDALTKRSHHEDQSTRTVSIVAIRNSGLPNSALESCQIIAQLLERQLVAAPGIALLERRRLSTREQESQIAPQVPLKSLNSAQLLIDLEFRRPATDRGVLVIGTLRTATNEIGRIEADAADLNAELSENLARKLLGKLDAGDFAKTLKVDHQQEAARYMQESKIRESLKEYSNAALAAEAAAMLTPDDLSCRSQVFMSLLQHVQKEHRLTPAGLNFTPEQAEHFHANLKTLARACHLMEDYLGRIDYSRPHGELSKALIPYWAGMSWASNLVQLCRSPQNRPPGIYGSPTAQELCEEIDGTLLSTLDFYLARVEDLTKRKVEYLPLVYLPGPYPAVSFGMQGSRLLTAEKRVGYFSKRLQLLESARAQYGESFLNCQWSGGGIVKECQNGIWSAADEKVLRKFLADCAESPNPGTRFNALAGMAVFETKGETDVPRRGAILCEKLRPIFQQTIEEWNALEADDTRSSAIRDANIRHLVSFLSEHLGMCRSPDRILVCNELVAAMNRHRRCHDGIVRNCIKDALESNDATAREQAFRRLCEAKKLSVESPPIIPLNGSLLELQRTLEWGVVELEAKFPQLSAQTGEQQVLVPQLLFQAIHPVEVFWGIDNPLWDGTTFWIPHFKGTITRSAGTTLHLGLQRVNPEDGSSDSFGESSLFFEKFVQGKPHPWITASAISAERLIFAGWNESLWEIDLATRKWGEISAYQELPSRRVTALAIHGKTIYVGLDSGVLAALDPRSTAPRIIVSSQRIEAQTPLDNRSAFSISFLAVAKNQKGLQFLAPADQDRRGPCALWNWNFDTHRVEKEFLIDATQTSCFARWNGDGRLVISSLGTAGAIAADEKSTFSLGSRPMFEMPTRFQKSNLGNGVARSAILLGDEFWSIDEDTGTFLKVNCKTGKSQSIGIAWPPKIKTQLNLCWRIYPWDGKRFLVSDGYRLWKLNPAL